MTAQTYVVVAELDMEFDENLIDELLPPVTNHHGAVQRSKLGRAEVVFTIAAISVRQAITAALAILDTYAGGVLSLRVLTATDFNRIADAIDSPRLLSAVHVARVLGNYRPPGRSHSDHGHETVSGPDRADTGSCESRQCGPEPASTD